jgi:hypothetical protein
MLRWPFEIFFKPRKRIEFDDTKNTSVIRLIASLCRIVDDGELKVPSSHIPVFLMVRDEHGYYIRVPVTQISFNGEDLTIHGYPH